MRVAVGRHGMSSADSKSSCGSTILATRRLKDLVISTSSNLSLSLSPAPRSATLGNELLASLLQMNAALSGRITGYFSGAFRSPTTSMYVLRMITDGSPFYRPHIAMR